MKNLKKVLALGLALVMLLGMFTIASAAEDKKVASDLTDWNTVNHKDAVSLMVDLGIINGMPDGSFAPTGNIDRASWAKMVYYAATGSDDADAYLGTASGLNDIAGNWAESYISFLKANNYISGDTNGNYNPSNNVTVAEACKMMLTVLGYDAEDRGYQNNAAWSGNIMTDAKRNGLMDNVDKAQTALVPLTRENAAEIVMNALNANMVEGIPQWDNGNRYITTYNKLGTLGYDVFDMVKLVATVDSIDTNGYAVITKITEPGASALNIAAGSISGKVKATSDMVGQDVNVYVRAEGARWSGTTGEISTTGTFKNMVSTSAAKADNTPIKVITGGITRWGDLTTRGASQFVATDFNKDCAFYYNGEAVGVTNATAATLKDASALTAVAAKTTTPAGLRGSVVEFYANADGEIATVKVYKYTVDKVENGDAQTKTLSDGTLQVRIPGVINTYVDADKVNGWQGLVEGDVVLYYTTELAGGGTAYTLEKANKVTGKVATYNSAGELSINGSRYKATEQGKAYTGDIDATDANFKNWLGTTVGGTTTDEYDFYLDKNGSVCLIEQITESMDQSKVCMVLATEVGAKGLGTSGSLRAELLFMDGTTAIVNVSKVDKKTVVDSTVAAADADKKINTADAKVILGGSKADGKDPTALQKFFNWKSTSAGYELFELNATSDPKNWETPAYKGDGSAEVASVAKESGFAKNKGATTALTGWNITADSTTTFVVGKKNSSDDTIAYSVFKGFKNIPEMDATMVSAICANTDTANTTNVNTVAKFVYLQTGLFKDDVPEGLVFIVDNEWSIDPELEDTYVVNIIDTDGTKTTMRVDETLKNAIGNESMRLNNTGRTYVGNFWEVGQIDENGVVTSLGRTEGNNFASNRAPAKKSVNSLGNDVIAFADGPSYDYDSATVFVFVDWGWSDSLTETGGTIGQRDYAVDDCKVTGYGPFSPNGFYNASDIGTEADGKTYEKVEAVAICPANSTTADYIYVVRTCW